MSHLVAAAVFSIALFAAIVCLHITARRALPAIKAALRGEWDGPR